MRLVETSPGMGEQGLRRMMEGTNSSVICLIYSKDFCKLHNVIPAY
jgi:hypothetical protein